jgi:hypothetical protein
MFDRTGRPGSPGSTRTQVYRLQPGGTAAQWMRAMMEEGMTCCLCGGPPVACGAFIPPDQAGRPPGQRLVCWYLLCGSCLGLPDWQARVETGISSQMARGPGATGPSGRDA